MGKVVRYVPDAVPICSQGQVDPSCPFFRKGRHPWLRLCTRKLLIKTLINRYDENAMIGGCPCTIIGPKKRKYQAIILKFREKEII